MGPSCFSSFQSLHSLSSRLSQIGWSMLECGFFQPRWAHFDTFRTVNLSHNFLLWRCWLGQSRWGLWDYHRQLYRFVFVDVLSRLFQLLWFFRLWLLQHLMVLYQHLHRVLIYMPHPFWPIRESAGDPWPPHPLLLHLGLRLLWTFLCAVLDLPWWLSGAHDLLAREHLAPRWCNRHLNFYFAEFIRIQQVTLYADWIKPNSKMSCPQDLDGTHQGQAVVLRWGCLATFSLSARYWLPHLGVIHLAWTHLRGATRVLPLCWWLPLLDDLKANWMISLRCYQIVNLSSLPLSWNPSPSHYHPG